MLPPGETTPRKGADRRLLERERAIVSRFIATYCRKKHRSAGSLCPECSELLDYALQRLDKCPYHPKPPCKQCPTHCYQPDMRRRIREVMKFSGMHFVKRGRLDWLLKYFLSNQTLTKEEAAEIRRQAGRMTKEKA